MKRMIALLIAFVLALSAAFFVNAATEDEISAKWDSITKNDSVISITPGADSTQMNFCWMSDLFSDDAFLYGMKPDLSDAEGAEIKKSLTAFFKKECNVTLEGLRENTTYYYRYYLGGLQSDIYSFTTDAKDEGFTALFVSDAQIGRSGDWQDDKVKLHDTTGWYTTLEQATENHPDISVCLSTGDQVQNATASVLYNLFLAPDTLRSLPIAVTPGNHEIGSPYLGHHFSNANEFENTVVPATIARPYYFTKGNALFIVLNTNNVFMLDHEALIAEAVETYPDAQWRVIMMHHGVYSCEDKDDDNPNNRNALVPMFEKYDIDLVLSGHSHMYSRTYVMKNFEKADEGIVYIEGGCASGSNCVLTPEELPDYAVVGNRIKSPVYTVLTFSEDEVGVEAYVVENGESVQIDETTIVRNERDDSNAQMSTGNKLLHFILSLPNRFFSLFY
ncbi:MAG: metallophosphoesterase family protein [Clostridia bacterium]|nr:metallophosphoesterase family protein [Clostridia bacterium]